MRKEAFMADKRISVSSLKPLFESKFLHVFDIRYAEGKHYYTATRRNAEQTAAVRSDEDFRKMVPDAVSCFVIAEDKEHEARMLLTKEYRYPVGRFILSVPAGLIDPEDVSAGTPALTAAVREIKEETGLDITDSDSLTLVNPLVFSTPGMTDESNALVCAVIRRDNLMQIDQTGAVGAECFDGAVMVTKEEAENLLRNGRDDEGFFYPAYTWMALMYFISGMWK